ncbi:MAG: PEP-CTERM sorting domain-containing protein [Planctomycetota bacterium]
MKSHPTSIRIACAALAIAFVTCSSANAEFYIDNFSILDTVNDASPTSIGSNGITVEVTGPGVSLDPVNTRYVFNAANIGDTFRVRYDWTGVFNDLQSVSGNQLESIAIGAFFGNWTMSIDTGVGGPSFYGPALPTILPSAIGLDDATELTFEFTYDGGSPIPGGVGVGTWGGLNNPLFATPEPTGLVMLGGVGLVGLMRRRRK